MHGPARVLLVNPPGLPGTTPNREGSAGLGALEMYEGGFCYPPHTLATVAAVLRDAGYAVSVFDAGAHPMPERGDLAASSQCLDALRDQAADVIGVLVSWATREADRRFLALLRNAALSVPTVALGPSTRLMADDLTSADYVLEGEPERAFQLLCDRLLSGHDDLPRTVTPSWLCAAGYDDAGLLTDLDALPIPAWELLREGSYPYLTVLGSRGCNAACRWCPYVVAQGTRYRARSPESVVAELRHLVERFGPPRIVFRDPVFAHDRARTVELCHLILRDHQLRPGRNLLWECESRPQDLDPALIRLMHLAGCVGVKLGLETVEPAVLGAQQRLEPGETAEEYLARVQAVVGACHRHGVAARLFVLAGLPGETIAGARATAAFAERLEPHSLTVKVLERYPHVRLAQDKPHQPPDPGVVDTLQRAHELVRDAARRPTPRWRRAFARLGDQAWYRLRGRAL